MLRLQLTTGLSNEYSLQTGRPKGTKSKDNPFAAMYANKILKFTTDEISYQWHKVRLLFSKRVVAWTSASTQQQVLSHPGLATSQIFKSCASHDSDVPTAVPILDSCSGAGALVATLQGAAAGPNTALRQRWSGTAGDQHAAYKCVGRAA